jgi:guanylate kinase
VSALEQRELAPQFTYTIVNDDLDRAIGELESLVRAKLAASRS